MVGVAPWGIDGGGTKCLARPTKTVFLSVKKVCICDRKMILVTIRL